MNPIDGVIRQNWERLVRGAKLDFPATEIEHPAVRPDLFQATREAWPTGQRCDYVWRLPGARRVHAQCMGTGPAATIRIHVDEYDPDAGFDQALLHFLLETPGGRIVGVFGLVLLLTGIGRAVPRFVKVK